MQRIDQRDFVYKSENGKFDAVVEDIVERHAKGQPVLVGTTSVEKSELLSAKLKKQGVPHEVLNAKQHAREASIVAQAGRKGAVTVATNMAGRGTDIMLGGNAEFMAVEELARAGSTRRRTPRSTRPRGPPRSPRPRSPSRRSTTRSPSSAACTCSGPSGTSRGASTTSCVVVPAGRATRGSRGSTCRCRTT